MCVIGCQVESSEMVTVLSEPKILCTPCHIIPKTTTTAKNNGNEMVFTDKGLKYKSESDDSDSDVSMSTDSDGGVIENSSFGSDSGEEEEKNDKQDNNQQIEEDDDEVVKAIKLEKDKKRDHPPLISSEDFIVDICFHPEKDIIAVANIMGDVLVYAYNDEETNLLTSHELHLTACRAVEFDSEGRNMYTTAKDKAIMVTDFETGKLKKCYENAHDEPVYCLHCLDDNKIVTGKLPYIIGGVFQNQ
ncbi:WD repeat-containing protein 55 homolog [Eumeta japonica]|uniref:WD repeat-containing protein 55 homolog n=1 Tax=Eumeta variegata TaxID=151549 RepID=A0A4C1VNT0_EUMVA|nr:WD repeat-containing protein 55 homolog [Eumeta japonica]